MCLFWFVFMMSRLPKKKSGYNLETEKIRNLGLWSQHSLYVYADHFMVQVLVCIYFINVICML